LAHGNHCNSHLVSGGHVLRCARDDLLELRRARGSGILSAKILPWRPRPAEAPLKQAAVYLPALIDGQVTIHALIEGLAAAGLRLDHDPATGKFVILAR